MVGLQFNFLQQLMTVILVKWQLLQIIMLTINSYTKDRTPPPPKACKLGHPPQQTNVTTCWTLHNVVQRGTFIYCDVRPIRSEETHLASWLTPVTASRGGCACMDQPTSPITREHVNCDHGDPISKQLILLMSVSSVDTDWAGHIAA